MEVLERYVARWFERVVVVKWLERDIEKCLEDMLRSVLKELLRSVLREMLRYYCDVVYGERK